MFMLLCRVGCSFYTESHTLRGNEDIKGRGVKICIHTTRRQKHVFGDMGTNLGEISVLISLYSLSHRNKEGCRVFPVLINYSDLL